MKKNKKVKSEVVIIIFGVVLITSLIIIIGTNFIINKYINDQAWETLNKEALWFKDVKKAQVLYDREPSPLFQAGFILLDLEELQGNSVDEMGYGRSADQKRLYNYYLENKAQIPNERIELVELEGSKYYFEKVRYKDEALSPMEGDVLIYISVDPVNRLISILNQMFALMIIPAVVIAVIAGIKSGSIIEDSQEKLKTFFENASHELKTPLMSIQGYAEGIKEDVITDYHEAATIILEESDRMERLVEGILQLSRLDSGARSMNMEVVNLCEVLREATFRIAYLASAKGVKVKLELPTTPIFVNCDETAMDQVFDNILSNGMRYAKSTLRVECHTDGPKVVVSIMDDGKGIDPEDIPHIFKRFYRGKSGNTGIGLALSKDIVERHKGKISVECNEDKGTAFTIVMSISNYTQG